MTRDEHRAKCIDQVEAAIISAIIDAGGTIDVRMKPVATAAFDAPHGIARANPIETTEEMITAGRVANLEQYTNAGLYERIWNAMSACGDLTNPPEIKL